MLERVEGPMTAVSYLQDHLDTLRTRFVTTWIKLQLEITRLLWKYDQEAARQAAKMGKRIAEELEFTARTREFARYIED